jgi:hypothetical protein
MYHPWYELVLGGVLEPRFFILKHNLIDDSNFEDGVLEFDALNGASISRVASDDAKGNYIAMIEGGGSKGWVNLEKDIEAESEGKRFIALFRMKTVGDGKVVVRLIGDDSEEISKAVINTSQVFDSYVIYGESEEVLSQNIILQIITEDDEDGEGDDVIYIDSVYLFEYDETFIMRCPQRTHLLFDKMLSGEVELNLGEIKEYNKQWQPNYIASWDYLSADDEIKRQRLSDSSLLMCMPHRDNRWAFIGVWG